MKKLIKPSLIALLLAAFALPLAGCTAQARIGRAEYASTSGDHDRGHGNDADGHDEDNPGRGHGRH